MKRIRGHLTYANVMSSLAVFLILGGATAFAAVQKIGSSDIKAKAVKTGKIETEAVTSAKIKNLAVTDAKLADGGVTTAKIADDAVTTAKIAGDAVTGDKVKESTLGPVPNADKAADSTSLGGIPASGYAQRMFARVSYTTSTPSLIAASPGITVSSETGLGFPALTFPRSMDNCAVVASASSGSGTQIVRRSTGATGTSVQFAIKDDTGTAIRASFDVIAVC
ncbi:MAG: hypothetical protein U0R71_17450 [Solirubrobacterales bacterium]